MKNGGGGRSHQTYRSTNAYVETVPRGGKIPPRPPSMQPWSIVPLDSLRFIVIVS